MKIRLTTKDAFRQLWKDLVKRAGIEDVHFADLRHEAGSRFDAAGLTKGERDLVMGHSNGDTGSIYIHAYLNRIRDKLDIFQLGCTWKDLAKQNLSDEDVQQKAMGLN